MKHIVIYLFYISFIVIYFALYYYMHIHIHTDSFTSKSTNSSVKPTTIPKNDPTLNYTYRYTTDNVDLSYHTDELTASDVLPINILSSLYYDPSANIYKPTYTDTVVFGRNIIQHTIEQDMETHPFVPSEYTNSRQLDYSSYSSATNSSVTL